MAVERVFWVRMISDMKTCQNALTAFYESMCANGDFSAEMDR